MFLFYRSEFNHLYSFINCSLTRILLPLRPLLADTSTAYRYFLTLEIVICLSGRKPVYVTRRCKND